MSYVSPDGIGGYPDYQYAPIREFLGNSLSVSIGHVWFWVPIIGFLLNVILSFFLYRFKDKRHNVLLFLSFTFTLYFYILDLSGFRFFPVGSCGTYLLGYIVTGATMSFAVFSMIDVFVVAYYFRDQKKKYMVCFLLETMATLALLPCYSSNIFIKNVIFSVITNNVYWLTFAIFVAKSALVMLYTPYLLYEFVYRKFSKKGGAAR